jgi:hypothetical protein
MDASRYLLLNLGGGPRMVMFDDPTPDLHEAEGLFSTRRAERDTPVGHTQRSPFA